MELKALYMYMFRIYVICFSWDPLRIMFGIIFFVLDTSVIQNDMSLVSGRPGH